ncbi:MAG: CDP-glycerol glycerophosphotransferase family protein [Selenomonadaceae bacterium]|nr:CDP-glycerol glycerophosphotransferase family protein [Selenomonadaceae bacterium]
MEKKDCVLVVLEEQFFEKTLQKLNFNSVHLKAVFMDESQGKFLELGAEKIPVISFAEIHTNARKYKTFTWLISGYSNFIDDFRKIKNFLITLGISENNIIDFGKTPQISLSWASNFSHLEKFGADFFATGDEYIQSGLNFDYIPCVSADKNDSLGGVNLADKGQSLVQGLFIAANIFKRVRQGKIKFVLIGLSPDSFCCNSAEDFLNFKNIFSGADISTEKEDLNYSEIKKNFNKAFSAKSVLEWEDNSKTISADTVEKNTQVLKQYIKLCTVNNAKPVGVVFPPSPAVRKTYDQNILKTFRETLQKLEKESDFICVDMFDLNLNYDCFGDIKHMNIKGTSFANAVLSMKLQKKDCIPLESFCDMSYEYLNKLAWVVDKDEYNNFAEKIFSVSAQKIRRKDKIKLGFVVRGAAEWCGDELYNLFARDKRFEVTIFNFLHISKAKDRLFREDYWNGIEQFKKRNLNVIALDKINTPVPEQDVFIFLSPYFNMMPRTLRTDKIFLKTLITSIPYGLGIALRSKGFYNRAIFNTAWKVFLPSKLGLDVYSSNNRVGLPRGLFSGHSKTDIFFKQGETFHFDWKTAHPNAKKIIYAPHWSINDGVKYATFQWNYQFMYEFAKSHPEISFVYKPHPLLVSSSVSSKLFSSTEAYEEYLQKWNDLPNAQVYSGAYYQGLFATSDGMIHDSGSFIAEYQFVNKPMIFLTRSGEKFNALGEEILKASYLVDGKNLDAIAETMQKIFIEGNDYKAKERKEVYDKYLNYPEYNGMLASEFIYKSIADGLKGES